MELNLPPEKETTVEVAESNLMTIRVDKDGNIFWNLGTELPKKIEIGKLAVDYPSEGLNDMARKINEIIDYLHAI